MVRSQLLVLEPEYERAAFLEGNVKDSLSTRTSYIQMLQAIRILTYNIISSSTNFDGNYFMGIDNTNTYNVEYSKEGYFIIDTLQVSLINGETTSSKCFYYYRVFFTKHGKIVDSPRGNGIPNCNLIISDNFIKDTIMTNQLGEFILDTLY